MGISSVSQNPLGYEGIDLFVNPPVLTLASSPKNVASPTPVYTGQLAVLPASQQAYINLGPYQGLPNWQQIVSGFSPSAYVIAQGNATLVSGTVSVSFSDIQSGDIVVLSLKASNSSTALGSLTYSITAGTGFAITSKQQATPASTQTGDISTVSYVVYRGL